MSATTAPADLTAEQVADLQPDCQAPDHVGDEPAVWALFARDPLPCGCVPEINPALICDRCLRALQSARRVYCRHCRSLATFTEMVQRVERI